MPKDTICHSIIQASIYVAEWIGRQPEVKEESITDWSLDWLAQRTNYRLAYKLFTRHEEARTTGADFEWWIVGNQRAFKARVQAKRLKSNADNYPSLAHANDYGLQILKLIENANAADAVALYMFYARSAVLLPRGKVAANGMFVAEAEDIDDHFVSVARQYVSDENVLNRSVPLSVIFCLAGSVNPLSGGLDTLVRFIRSERGPQKQRFQDVDLDGETGIYKEIPSAVESFIQTARQQGEAFPDAWFRDSFRDVDALFVIDLREAAKASPPTVS
jgi:hypothetical protein